MIKVYTERSSPLTRYKTLENNRIRVRNGQRAHSDTLRVHERGLGSEGPSAVPGPLEINTQFGQIQDHVADTLPTEETPLAQPPRSMSVADTRPPSHCVGVSSQLPIKETLIPAHIFHEVMKITGLSGQAEPRMISLRFLISYEEQMRDHLKQLS